MNSLFVLLFWAVIVVVGYWGYARWADRNVFKTDPKRATPAKMYMDGVDFMPANKNVLFGFQLNSIAGAAPIIGPIIALQWGWVPALLWLGLGVLFIGWVQDYSSAMISMRSDGATFGALSHNLISPRARKILLTFVYFYLLLIAAAFGNVIASVLSKVSFVAFPMLVIVGVALLVGQLIYRSKVDIMVTTVIAIVLIFGAIAIAKWVPINLTFIEAKGTWFTEKGWFLIAVLVFGYFSSILPVWRFIQPFNYSSVYVVYFGIIIGIVGIIIAGIGGQKMTMPAFISFWGPKSWPLWPMMFVTIACGAISGWHSLVSSTGTSRQLESEKDARPVAAGAMFSEFTISIIAVILCATFFASLGAYKAGLGNPAIFFGRGVAGAITTVFGGGPGSYMAQTGWVFGLCMIMILALTIVNLVFRFMKIATAELLGEAVPVAKNGHIATIVALILTFILVSTGSFRYIWVLFGGANQLMAGLALLLITLWLAREKKGTAMSGIPFIFMYVTTICALAYSGYRLITGVFVASNQYAAIKALAGGATELTAGWFNAFGTALAKAAGAVSGGTVFGNIFAAALSILLIVAALLLGYDGLKAYQKYRAAKAEAAPAEAPA
ncbi:MAG: carbon starvation protein A [Proteobacteria bacterium]|nr:carbon starvation protein A [Pseudomonadota bacterium]MBU1740400.1 carbon starvation protein A [Pseudomonadota bacterium]